MITSRPLSNGTMGSLWQQQWCNRCEHDHGFHNGSDDTDKACQILLRLVVDDVSVDSPVHELTDGNYAPDRSPGSAWDASLLVCSKFRECRPCTDPEWVPVLPPLRGQLDIFGNEVPS